MPSTGRSCPTPASMPGPCGVPLSILLMRAAAAAAEEGNDTAVSLSTLARLAGELAAETATESPCRHEGRRRLVLERALTRSFADLLPWRPGDNGRSGGAPLSRRLIPGLMKALTMMVGEDTMAERRDLAGHLLTDHRRGRAGDATERDTLARDPRMVQLIRDTLMTAAGHFVPFDRRLDWLCLVIDNNRPAHVAEDGDADWSCTRDRAVMLLDALYADLALALAQPGGEARLAAEHGAEAVLALRALLGTLAARRSTAGMAA